VLLRRKSIKDDDFVDNDERNRDPFRSYLRLFTGSRETKAIKVPAILDKFALEELTLIGIVSGDANPRAMFRDPAGMGQTIKRGDYLSKVAARVSKILSDRVILELNGSQEHLDAAVSYLEEVGCTVNTMEGDVIEG